MKIKAVIMTDGEHYFIHGTSDETPAEMFKAMHPIWSFDPERETVHFVELKVNLPTNSLSLDEVEDCHWDNDIDLIK